MEREFAPFGQEVELQTTADRYKLTGKERDAESGLDYFVARHYASSVGRFFSPDPLMVNELRLVNPQRFNLYSYAINNPVTFTDPTDRDVILATSSNEDPGGGHAGIMAVQADGTATYSRFGPQGSSMGMGSPSSAGISPQPLSLPSVEFGSDGLPTQSSYARSSNAVAVQENQSSGYVVLNYFKTSNAETASLLEYIKQRAAHENGPYEFLGNNFESYCNRGMDKAGLGQIVNYQRMFNPLDVPNLAGLFYWLFADDSQIERAPRYRVTSTLIFPKPVPD